MRHETNGFAFDRVADAPGRQVESTADGRVDGPSSQPLHAAICVSGGTVGLVGLGQGFRVVGRRLYRVGQLGDERFLLIE